MTKLQPAAMTGKRLPTKEKPKVKKAPPREKEKVKKILAHLRSKYSDGWWAKLHGSPFQQAGMPDIAGCWRGRFFGFEVKRDARSPVTAIQDKTLTDLWNAGATAGVVWEIEHVDAMIEEGVAMFGMRGSTENITAVGRYGPLEAGHVAVNSVCAACGMRIKAGNYIAMICLGPGPYPEEQERAKHGGRYIGIHIATHYHCATGESGSYDDDD